MAKCAFCNSTVVFGGKREGSLPFCNARCHEAGYPLVIAEQIPDDIVEQRAREFHDGVCPKCGGPGPVDIHTTHFIWSAVIITSWRSTPLMCCRSCGVKAQANSLLGSLIVGWWGAWGFFLTPVQVVRNIYGLLHPHDPQVPSPDLVRAAKVSIAHEFVAHQRGDSNCPHCGAPYNLDDYDPDAESIRCSQCKGGLDRGAGPIGSM